MTSKEMLEKVRTAMVNHLTSQKVFYEEDNDQDGITDLEEDIRSVEKAKTVGDIGTIACDRCWDVDAWTSFFLGAILDDTKYVGDIPDHWST